VSPITHLLSGWALATVAPVERRDRAIITLACVVPDIDAFGLPFEFFTRNSPHPLTWWSDYHHVLGHNVGFALFVAVLAWSLAKRRVQTAALAFLAFNLHLLEDLAGARGPDGYQWPIPFLLPFSSRWQWVWSGQWALNSVPNLVLTAALIGFALYVAWSKGHSPVEFISKRADDALVAALRRRFPRPAEP
jgi:hypothetical protein